MAVQLLYIFPFISLEENEKYTTCFTIDENNKITSVAKLSKKSD